MVHGLLRSAAVDDLGAVGPEGAGDAQVVRHGDLAALVSEAGDEVLPTPENLRAHLRLLEQTAARRTVLPMRFGVVVEDRDSLVATFLAPDHDELLGRIEHLADHVELRVRGTYDEEEVLREVLASDRRAARLRGRRELAARVELGERVTSGIAARRDRDTARVAEFLGPLATEVSHGHLAEPLDAFSVSFLVERGEVERFDLRVEELAETLVPLARVTLAGPLPPFSFANGTR